MLTAVVAFGFGVWIIAKTLIWGDAVAGYPSLMSVMLFLGGMQLVALGVIGEYLGRLYQESKQRPLYLIDRVCQGDGSDDCRPGRRPSALSSTVPNTDL